MSRDAFSYDPQDAGETRDTVHAPTPPVNRDQHLLTRVTAGIRRQKLSVVAIAPRLGSSILPARNAAILRAPITFATVRISSAIPR